MRLKSMLSSRQLFFLLPGWHGPTRVAQDCGCRRRRHNEVKLHTIHHLFYISDDQIPLRTFIFWDPLRSSVVALHDAIRSSLDCMYSCMYVRMCMHVCACVYHISVIILRTRGVRHTRSLWRPLYPSTISGNLVIKLRSDMLVPVFAPSTSQRGFLLAFWIRLIHAFVLNVFRITPDLLCFRHMLYLECVYQFMAEGDGGTERDRDEERERDGVFCSRFGTQASYLLPILITFTNNVSLALSHTHAQFLPPSSFLFLSPHTHSLSLSLSFIISWSLPALLPSLSISSSTHHPVPPSAWYKSEATWPSTSKHLLF